MKLLPLLLLSLLASVHIDHSKVRYGDSASFDEKLGHSVGVVDSKQVYAHIPAYKQIIKEKVKEGSARYYNLLLEATTSYKKVIKKVAKKHGYALVVEVGGISGYETKDITQTCINSL